MSLNYGWCYKTKRWHEYTDLGPGHKCKWCKKFVSPKPEEQK